jgi:hypothetical protein
VKVGLAAVALAAAVTVPLSARAALPSDPPAAGCPSGFPAYDRAAVASSEEVLDGVRVTMSDGIELAVDVHLPVGVPGPFPTVVTVTGYGRGSLVDDGALVTHGYALVMVDDRGTGASGGSWDLWSERTQADYPEIYDWVVAQPWSDGSIALAGTSYMGITTMLGAASQHPALRAAFAVVPMADSYRDIGFAGGQVNVAFVPAWLGLVTGLSVLNAVQAPQELVEHVQGIATFQIPLVAQGASGGDPAYDSEYWRLRSPIEHADRVRIPTFVVGGLDDLFQRGEPMLYEALADHVDARLLLGPWAHLTIGSGLPRDGVPTIDALRLQWFDRYVRGLDTGIQCIPAVTQYVRGIDAYRSAPTWPVPDLTAERWYLRADTTLTNDPPGETESSRAYRQLPVTGVCTRSTAQWLIGAIDQTPCATDNRLDEANPLVLTYTTAPFTDPVYVNGPIEADLWVVPSTSEAVVSVAVSDVAPDGSSRGLTNGLLSADHRAVDPARSRFIDGESIQPWHPFTRDAAQEVTPGEPVLLRVEVFPTSAVIAPGHRLRVAIAPFDVPHALPPVPGAVPTLIGQVSVLSDASHPSSVLFPVVGDGAGDAHGSEVARGADAAPAASPGPVAVLPRQLAATGTAAPLAALAAGSAALAAVLRRLFA